MGVSACADIIVCREILADSPANCYSSAIVTLASSPDTFRMSSGKQDPISSRFGRAVRQSRDDLGISQEELAARCSLHRTYLAGIESGNRNPSLKSIVRLATGLGTTASQLFQCFEKIGSASPRPRKQR